MAINTAEFKDALQKSLETSAEIVAFTGHGQIDPHTTQPAIRIHEAYAEFPSTQRHVVFDLADVNSFVKESPTSGYYISKVLIYGVTQNTEETTYLTDLLQSFFTCRPTTDRKWFRNISSDCITNLFTIYRSRLRPGLPFKHDADSWVDGIEVDFTWYWGNCDREPCELTIPTDCGTEDSETEFSPDSCPCD